MTSKSHVALKIVHCINVTPCAVLIGASIPTLLEMKNKQDCLRLVLRTVQGGLKNHFFFVDGFKFGHHWLRGSSLEIWYPKFKWRYFKK